MLLQVQFAFRIYFMLLISARGQAFGNCQSTYWSGYKLNIQVTLFPFLSRSKYFSVLQHIPVIFWVPTQPFVQWVKVTVLEEQRDWNAELTVHPNLAQRPRMRGNPHFPHTPLYLPMGKRILNHIRAFAISVVWIVSILLKTGCQIH